MYLSFSIPGHMFYYSAVSCMLYIPHVAACFAGTIFYCIMPNSLAIYFSMVAWCKRTSDGQLYDVEREVLHVSAPLIHPT